MTIEKSELDRMRRSATDCQWAADPDDVIKLLDDIAARDATIAELVGLLEKVARSFPKEPVKECGGVPIHAVLMDRIRAVLEVKP
jgi:hypothetical protein